MANIKSAKKRILVNETKAARNKAIKSKVKTCVKKVETAVAKKDAAAAAEALKVAIGYIALNRPPKMIAKKKKKSQPWISVLAFSHSLVISTV